MPLLRDSGAPSTPSRVPHVATLLAGLLFVGAAPAFAQDGDEGGGANATEMVLSEFGGQPAAGRYHDDSLGVDVEFTLTDAWADGWAARPFGVNLETGSGARFVIGDVDGYLLARPCMVEDDDTYPDEHADITLTPEAVIGHWQANPLLRNEGIVPVSVAGTEGYQLDVRVDLSGLGRRCVDPEVPLWGKERYGTFALLEDARTRLIVFEVEGKVIVLVLEGIGRVVFDEALELGMPIVESMTVVPREEGMQEAATGDAAAP